MGLRTSVLIAAYNAEATLEASLLSVLHQLSDEDQLIVVDDGSTDGTVRIASGFNGYSQFHLVQTAHMGLAAALNAGIEVCSGEIVSRLDADDEMLPNRIYMQRKEFESRPSLVLVGGNMIRIGANGNVLGQSNFPLEHDEILADLLKGDHALCHSAVAISRRALLQVGGYWTEGVAEDWDLYLRLSRVGTIMNLPEAVVRYTYHGGSINALRLRQVRVGIHLAIENYRRTVANRPPLTRNLFSSDMSRLVRSKIWLEVSSLKVYRSALIFKDRQKKVRYGACLLLAACVRPRLAYRRGRSRLKGVSRR